VEVPRRLEVDYRVRFDEAGPDGLLRSSGFLRYAQDLAWQHSEAAGLDRSWYAARGLQWLVRAVRLEIAAGVTYGETARVSTEVIGWRRMWARRRTTFRTEAGLIAVALTDWVLLNAAGRAVRVPEDVAQRFADVRSFEAARVPLRKVGEPVLRMGFSVRARDLDPLGHVNNAAYLDYLEELLAVAGGLPGLPRSYVLEYLRGATLGERLEASLWQDEAGWSVRLTGHTEDEVIRARATGGQEPAVSKIRS
jgi:acyl-ACP thioesterase